MNISVDKIKATYRCGGRENELDLELGLCSLKATQVANRSSNGFLLRHLRVLRRPAGRDHGSVDQTLTLLAVQLSFRISSTTAFIFDDPLFALLRQQVLGPSSPGLTEPLPMSRPSISHQPSYTNGVKRPQLFEDKYEDPRRVIFCQQNTRYHLTQVH